MGLCAEFENVLFGYYDLHDDMNGSCRLSAEHLEEALLGGEQVSERIVSTLELAVEEDLVKFHQLRPLVAAASHLWNLANFGAIEHRATGRFGIEVREIELTGVPLQPNHVLVELVVVSHEHVRRLDTGGELGKRLDNRYTLFDCHLVRDAVDIRETLADHPIGRFDKHVHARKLLAFVVARKRSQLTDVSLVRIVGGQVFINETGRFGIEESVDVRGHVI